MGDPRRIGLASFWSADGAWGALTPASLRPTLSAFAAMIICGVCFHAGPLRRLLELRPGGRCAGRSSIYCLAATGAVLVVALVRATPSYHLLEEAFHPQPHPFHGC